MKSDFKNKNKISLVGIKLFYKIFYVIFLEFL
nr:MAG TPA: hypothetical protein [Caudoviricetes sp.]